MIFEILAYCIDMTDIKYSSFKFNFVNNLMIKVYISAINKII